MAVFKLLRPKSQWPSPDQPSHYPTYYMKIRVNGKQILMNTKAVDKATAERIEAAAVRKGRDEGAAALLAALEPMKSRRTGATIGEVIEAYLAPGVRITKNQTYARRNVNSLRRVVAFAKGLWRVNTGGLQGVKVGAQVVDEARIHALRVTELTAELRRDYFRAAQGGNLDWNEPREGNTTINSTLAQACDVFSRDAVYHKLGGLVLPDLTGFRTGPLLPEEDAQPDPLNVAQFGAMLEAAAALKVTDPELWRCNLMLRQTALRSAYAEAARGTWLEWHEGRCFMIIRNRPEQGFRKKRGTRDQQIPLTAELAEALAGRPGPLLLPDGADHERAELVRVRHNAWLKSWIGAAAGASTQGNHRLRDTVASILWSIDRPTAAQEALGHSSVDTTAKHYGKKIHVSPAMRAEMAAWTAA